MTYDLLRNIYNSFHGWYIAVAMVLFIAIYGVISYLASSHTTTVPLNMGIPVADYVGEYWATYIARVAISVPLTILVIWLLLHLIKVAFKIDLVAIIKRVFEGTSIYDLINKADSGLERAEISTAKFIHSLKDKAKSKDKADVEVKPYKKTTGDVFNVPDNIYTYEEAPAVCEKYNARLATYQEVEGAYNDNKEWCKYGWSDGQMALFPTQQATYDSLQKQAGHENDCGRPGVNGGRFDPKMKFGVNCYGKKPNL